MGRTARHTLIALAATLGGCGDNVQDDLYFTFDDRQVLCGFAIDDYINPIDWRRLQQRIDLAVDQRWVLDVYAHAPGVTITADSLDRAFAMFERAGLAWTTYRDLDPTADPFAGVVFAFDDDSVDAWIATSDLLERHHAKVTFFVSGFAAMTADQHTKLHQLADAGHDIEAHTVHHLDAVEYSAAHGVDAYLQDEVLPSFQVLRDDGFAPESFAYPFGSRSDETDRAIEPFARYLRTTPGPCPR